MSAPKVISGLDLQVRLAASGYNSENWSVADRQYAMPSESFLTGAFSSALWSLLNFFRVLNWVEDAHDCDDFARVAAAFAQILHVHTPGRPPATALAVGEFWYVRPDGTGHAINLAVCGDAVVAYEPQTRSEIVLSAQEKLNGKLIRF